MVDASRHGWAPHSSGMALRHVPSLANSLKGAQARTAEFVPGYSLRYHHQQPRRAIWAIAVCL